MFGLHTADIVVLVAYLVGIIAIGIGAARFVKNMGDYFMPRSFGKGMLVRMESAADANLLSERR